MPFPFRSELSKRAQKTQEQKNLKVPSTHSLKFTPFEVHLIVLCFVFGFGSVFSPSISVKGETSIARQSSLLQSQHLSCPARDRGGRSKQPWAALPWMLHSSLVSCAGGEEPHGKRFLCISRDWQRGGPTLLFFRSVPRKQSQICQGTRILTLGSEAGNK